ncbi:MAG: methylated-DNA--[protein]-cysteine S-methyltransferase, partial [Acidobacteriaceae bacterium]|nr:methylated-DNA--[protein]-cysteine S-methyltransferase [Acidobacteriaceae bacterium]
MSEAGGSIAGTVYTEMESPIGPLLLVADDAGLREILFVNGRHRASAN